MNPIELYNELRFKGYFDYNLFSKVLNQKYDPKGKSKRVFVDPVDGKEFSSRVLAKKHMHRFGHQAAVVVSTSREVDMEVAERLLQNLQIMAGDIIAEDSFVDSDEEGNEMYGYILLLPKSVGDNWYQLELYFHMYDETAQIEIEFWQMEEPGWRVETDKHSKGVWFYDKDKPLENILLNWLDINPLEVKQ